MDPDSALSIKALQGSGLDLRLLFVWLPWNLGSILSLDVW